jgi:ParB/RepB/Spo0J family partition protein
MVQQSLTPSQFKEKNKHYIESCTETNVGTTITFKDSAVSDRTKWIEIQEDARSVVPALKKLDFPKIGFILPKAETVIALEDKVNLFLHESDIEDGGPQPRTKIDPADPSIQSLFKSIDMEGQRDPIKVYPSPTTPGKYRIRDGHCRRFVIFILLRRPEIWAVSEKRTEFQVYKDAFILNDRRNNLTGYDAGHYIAEVLMKKFPEKFPTYVAVAKELGVTPEYVLMLARAYETVAKASTKLSVEEANRVSSLSEKSIRQANRIEEDLKADVLKEMANNKMTTREAEVFSKAVAAESAPTPEKVKVIAEEVVTAREAKKAPPPIEEPKQSDHAEIAAALMADAQKADKQIERAVTKAAAIAIQLPEDLMTSIYGHLNAKEKVDTAKVEEYAKTVVAILYERTSEEDLEKIFEATDKQLEENQQ